MIKSFRSRAMEQVFNGNVRRVQPNLATRIEDILAALHRATAREDLEKLTGSHELSGKRSATYSVTVTRNWRITFARSPRARMARIAAWAAGYMGCEGCASRSSILASSR
jgi:plasmid maintenance system killer protein